MKLRLLLAILLAIAAPLQSVSTQNAPACNRDRSQYVGFINERDLAWRLFGAAGSPPGVRASCLVVKPHLARLR
jgi:hypothetical protein